ncbi:MAG: beta-propeller domain-containing protein [Clostridia bacterium]|nr:beta-propeller domain-containing protein [Clostridia bacterium]
MKKDVKNALNEKMQVKLPETLNKENILSELENKENNIIEMPKKNKAKKILPIAASFMLVVGLVGMYFGLGLGDKNAPVIGEGTGVVNYQSYDKIYDRFDELHKEYKKENFFDMFGNAVEGEFANNDSDTAAPESAVDGSDDTATNMNGQSNPAGPSANGGSSHGTTNTQEKDVDEGDIIKTDGRYLYIVNSGTKAPVSIVDTENGEMKKVADITLELNESVTDIYIYNNYLVILGNCDKEEENTQAGDFADDVEIYNTYQSVVAWGDTFVKVYDITDKTAPEKVTEYVQEGTLKSSRMIGSKLYTISTYYVNVYNKNYRDDCIPEIETNGACEKVPAGCISIVEETKSTTYAVITTLDVEKDKEPLCEAILGECNQLYASSKGLFLSETDYWDEKNQETTKIYRFEYTDNGVEFKCMGKVAGFINNQFSMSYDGEYFRIATTLDKVTVDGDSVSMSMSDRVNNLYILNNDMEIVGKVEDLAKGELIKSVRFVGNMAYVVTFRQTDPLFVIDLTDPINPTVKGELKIPGFSQYLHPIADGYLIGVGQDGTETGVNDDCKVSLFDVTNPYEPKETISIPVSNGKAYVYTEVAYNHKLYINLSESDFAVPFSTNDYWSNGKLLQGNHYIRYNFDNGNLSEVVRYDLGDDVVEIRGATYIGNTFYAVVGKSMRGVEIVSFDLNTNEKTGSLQTYEWIK